MSGVGDDGAMWWGLIRDVPGFPRPGIVFKDITPLLGDPAGLAVCVDELAAPFEYRGVELVAAPEARGFAIGGMVADRLGAGFVPLRPKAQAGVGVPTRCQGRLAAPGVGVSTVSNRPATSGTRA